MSHGSNAGKEIVETLSRILSDKENVFSFITFKEAFRCLGYGAVAISYQKFSIAVILLYLIGTIISFSLGMSFLVAHVVAMLLPLTVSLIFVFMTDLEEDRFVAYFSQVKFSKYAEVFPAEVTRLILRDLAGAKSQNEIHEVLLKHNVDKKVLFLVKGTKRKS